MQFLKNGFDHKSLFNTKKEMKGGTPNTQIHTDIATYRLKGPVKGEIPTLSRLAERNKYIGGGLFIT